MVMAVQTLEVHVLSCGGMFDLMSEQEATFLVHSLGLFRNVKDLGRAVPRANTSLTRAYTESDFFRAIASNDHILHLIAHGDAEHLQTGNGKSTVTATKLATKGRKGSLRLPPIVVSTACEFQSPEWRTALAACKVQMLIAADSEVTPANLTAFDMAFYSALLTRVRKGSDTRTRVQESFELANNYYRGIHAVGTPYSKFSLFNL